MCPIRGVSDRPRLPRLGKIRLGEWARGETGKEYPRATPYFVCPAEVQEVFGLQPTDLRIVFPTEQDELWASTWYRSYSSSRGLVCRGDGETASRRVDLGQAVDANGALPDGLHPAQWPPAGYETQQADWREIECPPDTCPQYTAGNCRPTMNLQFLLPDVPGLGVWQLDTSSWNSIRNIHDGIRFIRALVGKIAGIPLNLSLVEQEVYPEGGTKKTVYVLQISGPYRLAELHQYAALPAAEAVLPAPVEEEPPDDATPAPELGDRLADLSSRVEAPAEPQPQPDMPPPLHDPSTFGSTSDLFRACHEMLGLQPKDVLRDLGYSNKTEIANLQEAYWQVLAVHGIEPASQGGN